MNNITSHEAADKELQISLCVVDGQHRFLYNKLPKPMAYTKTYIPYGHNVFLKVVMKPTNGLVRPWYLVFKDSSAGEVSWT